MEAVPDSVLTFNRRLFFSPKFRMALLTDKKASIFQENLNYVTTSVDLIVEVDRFAEKSIGFPYGHIHQYLSINNT